MIRKLVLIIISILLISCARVGSPVGGSKDSIAPQLLKSNIDSTRVNVSTNLKELRLDFDEYITLKDIQKNLIISPPIKIKKIYPTSLGSKSIEILWDEQLLPNTTYNFNFGNSIADLNEGNILPYFHFAFSTGEKLDDLYISGDIRSGYTFSKEKNNSKNNFIVGLYQANDSIDYSKKPYYITKADDDGYFELNFLTAGKYKLIAFNDSDQNSVFTEGKDEIYFENEILDLKENISGKKIRTLPSKKPLKFVNYKELNEGFLFVFEGKPQNVEITPEVEKLKIYKSEHKKYSDSAFVWFDERQLDIPQNNVNIPLKFNYQADSLKGKSSPYYKANVKTEFAIKNALGTTVPPNGTFIIESTKPITEINPNKWTLKVDSINTQNFSAKITEYSPYKILINSDFTPNKKYQLHIPKESISSHFQKLPQSYQFNFDIDKTEHYGSLEMRLTQKPSSPFWIQLLDEQHAVKYSQFTNVSNIKFSLIKPGQYYVRILVDENQNGIWDEADFKNQRPAEPVFIYEKTIEIRPLWENIEDQWGVNNLNEQPKKTSDEKDS